MHLVTIVADQAHDVPELIGEEIYDEFDSEGHSRLKHYVAPSKRKGSRQENSTTGPSPTIGSDANTIQVTSSPMLISPALPDATSADYLAPAGVSLGPSLSALVRNKKMRADSGSRTPSKRGKPRRSSAPATPAPDAARTNTGDTAVGDEAAVSILHEQEKSAPDIHVGQSS